MTRKFTPDQIRSFWTEQALRYAQSPDASWSDRRLIELEIEEMVRHVEDGHRVLDIGCANGFSTIQLASRRSVEITGLDYIPEMIEQARVRLEAERAALRGVVSFDVGDILGLRMPTDGFDRVIVTRVLINLSSWDNQRIALQEALRVVWPGGMLLLSEATLQGWERLNAFRREWGLLDIPMPAFNCYLDQEKVIEAASKLAELVDVVHFASSYYVGTRVIKPLLIEALGRQIDVGDPAMEWNRWLSMFPSVGDYGVQRLFLFQRK